MARRDRRRRGAHSASSDGDGSPASPTTGDDTAPTTGAAPAPVTDPGTRLTGRDRRAAARSASVDTDRKAKKDKKAKKDEKAKKSKKKGKRSWLDRVLLAGVIVVALALVAVGASYAYVTYRFNQVAKVTVKHLRTAPPGQPFNVLIIGSDSRVGLSTQQQTL